MHGLAVLLPGIFLAARRGDERVVDLLNAGDGLSDYAALVAAFAAAAAVLVNTAEPVYGLVAPLV